MLLMTGHQTILTVTVSDWMEWIPTLSMEFVYFDMLINTLSL
jgi:hypothetical protein